MCIVPLSLFAGDEWLMSSLFKFMFGFDASAIVTSEL